MKHLNSQPPDNASAGESPRFFAALSDRQGGNALAGMMEGALTHKPSPQPSPAFGGEGRMDSRLRGNDGGEPPYVSSSVGAKSSSTVTTRGVRPCSVEYASAVSSVWRLAATP